MLTYFSFIQITIIIVVVVIIGTSVMGTKEKSIPKFLQMTEKRMKSVMISLIVLPVSMICFIFSVSIGVLHPYSPWLLIFTIYISMWPWLITLIRCLISKKIPMNFYPIISVPLLYIISIIHFIAILEGAFSLFLLGRV